MMAWQVPKAEDAGAAKTKASSERYTPYPLKRGGSESKLKVPPLKRGGSEKNIKPAPLMRGDSERALRVRRNGR